MGTYLRVAQLRPQELQQVLPSSSITVEKETLGAAGVLTAMTPPTTTSTRWQIRMQNDASWQKCHYKKSPSHILSGLVMGVLRVAASEGDVTVLNVAIWQKCNKYTMFVRYCETKTCTILIWPILGLQDTFKIFSHDQVHFNIAIPENSRFVAFKKLIYFIKEINTIQV